MTAKDELFFPPFRLDLTNEQLFRGEQQLQVRPKNFAVLRQLVEHAGQVVRKEDLIKTIWGKYESEGALKQSIFQLREQLKDDAEEPRFIATVPRGYRFIAEIKRWLPQEIPLPSNFVGRSEELEQLQCWAERAKRGERQIVFVTGEPGIGKTTLIDAIVAQLAVDPTVWIGRGQCIEQYGEGEAYLPILEALGRIGRRAGAEQFGAFLGRYAPTWLAQLPALIDEEKQEALQRRVQGATRQRMLRELVEAVEIFTSEETDGATPSLVLILEDLQWSDHSTLELLSSLTRRQEPARLLILGTYRPAEGLVEGHLLRAITQELLGHGQCQELALGFLSAEAVEIYIEKRFPSSVLPSRFAEALYLLTNGNPLFLVTIVDDLVRQAILVEVDGHWVLQTNVDAIAASVPDNIRQLITRQIDRLGANEQKILEAASIAGLEFSAAAVAAAVETDRAELETYCDMLVRGNQFLQPAGHSKWPDGTVASRYSFRHAQYQYLWQERVSLNERQRFHQRIGERQEAAYGDQVGEVAAELAVHFGEGRDFRRALHYRQQAAMNALQRSAYQEAINHLTIGLDYVRILPLTQERVQHELTLQTNLGRALIAAQGWAAPATGEAYAQARRLCQQYVETPRLFPVLFGRWSFHLTRGEHEEACELGRQLLSLAQSQADTSLLVEAYWTLGCSLFFLGELVSAREHLECGLSLYKRDQHSALAALYGQDPGVSCLCYSALTLWRLGYAAQALQRSDETLALARELNHPFSLTWAVTNVALLYQLCGNDEYTRDLIKEGLALAIEHGFALSIEALSLMWNGMFVLPGQGEKGAVQLEESIRAYRSTGVEMYMPYQISSLAAVYGKAGQPEKGLEVIYEALTLVNTTKERHAESELYRMKGVLLRQQARNKGLKTSKTQQLEAEAEACFQQALHLAREQKAKIFELRAVMSLCQLWQHQTEKRSEARKMLTELYDWFSEGFETLDLKQARVLLEKLRDERGEHQ